MPTATVNGKSVDFEPGMTVLQVCELAGEEIPRFCYHERLEIAGNCRMCLVQIEGGPPKPAASCAMPAGNNMVIHTNTPMVQKAREGVMEFLLINHPLDCPICDQAGECDLQDQSMAYGRGDSRYTEYKRGVKDKYIGPLIKTVMTRCIHCTRCVRFIDDVAGTSELGATGRGEHMEIGTFVANNVTSELSGNVIDLCPVGALTSRPYAFKARSWELRKTESIDVLDAVGSNIRVDARGNEVMRILPRLNEDINEEWISDKTRFSYDGLKSQRLDRPYVRKDGKLVEASWDEALEVVAQALSRLEGKEVAAIAGDMADMESMLLLKMLMTHLGSSNMDCRQDGADVDASKPASYLFNSGIVGIEEADALLIVGANPRHEATLVNARIRKWWFKKRKPIALVGEAVDLTYPYEHLGDKVDVLEEIADGSHPFSSVLKKAKRPMIIVGSQILTRTDSQAVQYVLKSICDAYKVVSEEWNGYNVLHMAASRVGGLLLGFTPGADGRDVPSMLKDARDGKVSVLYLLGADEIELKDLKKSFIIYQGHHGDRSAHYADVILPGAAYTEKQATYVNLEGRVQRTQRAVFPPGQAQEDWEIVRNLMIKLHGKVPFNSVRQVREAMMHVMPALGNLDECVKAPWQDFGKKGKLQAGNKLFNPVENYYMTNAISRASKIMAACVAELMPGKKQGKKVA